MRRLTASVFLILVILSSSGNLVSSAAAQQPLLSQPHIKEESQTGFSWVVSIPWQRLEQELIEINGLHYTRLNIPSYYNMVSPGLPALPFLTEHIAIPFGVSLEVQVNPGKAHIRYLEHPVVPAPTQIEQPAALPQADQPLSLSEMSRTYQPDPTIYSIAETFPSQLAEVSNIGVMRQQRIAGISLYPIQYEPASGKLTFYETLTVEVRFNGKALTSSNAPNPESPYFEQVFRSLLLNYSQSLAWRMSVNEQSNLEKDEPSAASSWLHEIPWTPPEPAWRISLSQSGLYQLTYNELEQAGLDVQSLDPQTFQLFNLGAEVAIFVQGEEDHHFDESDSLYFYGLGIDDKYTSDNVYWLTYGLAPGLRMQTRDVAPAAAAQALSGSSLLPLETNNYYWPNLPGEDELERFYWSIVTAPNQWDANFDLFAVADGSGALDLSLAGFTSDEAVSPDHHAIIYMNGVQIGELTWDGKATAQLHADIPAGILIEGPNTLTISLPGDTGAFRDWVVVDKALLQYERAFSTNSGWIKVSYELTQGTRFTIAGFTASDITLFDLTTPAEPRLLQNIQTDFVDPTYTITFEEEDSLTGPIDYFALQADSVLSVSEIEPDLPSDLRSTQNGADYIIITPSEFSSQANTLALHRQAQGLRALSVDLQDVYDEFGYGITGSQPIHNFLAYAYGHWTAPAPSFVVLVGDGHYNPKGYRPDVYGAWRESFLPPYLAKVDPNLGETAADHRYVTLVGDDLLPEMMLGRLAVNSPEHAAAFIDKIIAYETQPAEGAWRSQVLAVADDADYGGNFPALSQTLLTSSLPAIYTPERVYLGVTHPDLAAAKSAILSAINTGKVLVNYIGHAAERQWADGTGGLLAVTDVPGLTNADKYPFVVAMTCKEGYYINPQAVGNTSYESLAEVLTRAANKGALATWSPTGNSVASGHDIINQALFNALFSDHLPTLGQATLAAKAVLWAGGVYLELMDTYLLFGDPASNILQLPRLYLPLINK